MRINYRELGKGGDNLYTDHPASERQQFVPRRGDIVILHHGRRYQVVQVEFNATHPTDDGVLVYLAPHLGPAVPFNDPPDHPVRDAALETWREACCNHAACPKCFQPRGSRCMRADGTPRIAVHTERAKIYRDFINGLDTAT